MSYTNERSVVRRLLLNLFADGWTVEIDDGSDGDERTPVRNAKHAIEEMTYTRDDGKPAWHYGDVWIHAAKDGHRRQWLYFVFGNGDDGWYVLADYTVGLESIVNPVMKALEAKGVM